MNPSQNTLFNSIWDEILVRHCFDEAAFSGWLYSVLIDKDFIESAMPQSSADTALSLLPTTSSQDDDFAVEQLLDSHSPIATYANLCRVNEKRSGFLVEDSFKRLHVDDLKTALDCSLDRSRFNVVIIGGGCTGLSMASAMKLNFRDTVNVFAIERRVSSLHIKKPYSRAWPTMIPTEVLKGVVEPTLLTLFECVGAKGYMGVPINIFETLLLISCKQLGVNFYFDCSSIESALENSAADLVVDATGGRLLADFTDQSLSDGPTFTRHHLENYGVGYRRFGIMRSVTSKKVEVKTMVNNGKIFPSMDGRPINIATLKITNVPLSRYQRLVEMARRLEPQARMYVWPGMLKDEINSLLLLINLFRVEYESLSSLITTKQSLCAGLRILNGELAGRCNGQINELLLRIRAIVGENEQVQIEPPFIYKPFLHPYSRNEAYCGKPLLRIGDSTFNGNPKTGNGLSFHLMHIRQIVRGFARFLT